MGGQWRWTTRLGLERARCLSEVGLETEPEWRLLEWLRANQLLKEIKLAAAGWIDAENPKGRAWFHLRDGTCIRYDGSNGFLVRKTGVADRFLTLEGMVREWGEWGRKKF